MPERKLLHDQREKAFFDPTPDRQNPHLPARPTEEEILASLREDNSACPLNKIVVGKNNQGNMRTIRRCLFTGLKRYNHSMRGMNMGIYASSGQGKSFIAKQIAKTTGLPLVELQAPSVDDAWSIFQEMKRVADEAGTPMGPQTSELDYLCPSMVVIIDEAHALKPKLMKGGLLNATEADDGWLNVSPPNVKGGLIRVDCRNVMWIVCTTERGMLFDAFDNRFSVHINWASADVEEGALIVKRKLDGDLERGDIPFTMPMEAARLVSQFRRVPREAIGFSRKMVQEKDMSNCSWEDAANRIAKDMGLNKWGMTVRQVKVLSALGQRPISKNNLTTVAGCRIEELERYVLPELMDYSNGGPLMASMPRGSAITRAGLKRLDEMGIKHRGDTVTVEYAEERK